MRVRLALLAGALALCPFALPEGAEAACRCICVGGEPRGVCSSPGEIEPICLQLCPVSLGRGAVVTPLDVPGVVRGAPLTPLPGDEALRAPRIDTGVPTLPGAVPDAPGTGSAPAR